MESHKGILFYEKCRLCLDKNGVKDIFNVADLSENILTFAGVKVSPLDNLPQKICLKCLEIVVNAKELRLLATKNDDHLRSLFGNDDEEPDNITNISLVERTYLEPQVIINSEEENYKTKKINVKEEKSNDMLSLNTDKTDEKRTKEIKVRKDLFEPSSAKLNNSVITVHSKGDYENVKKKIKLEHNLDFESVQYECEKCSKSFETWKKLYLHVRLHNKKMPCPCDGCGKMFATKGDLEKHLRTHTGVRPYVCDICEKSFTQHGTLKVHKETVHYSFVLPHA